MNSIYKIIDYFRDKSFSERDKGDRFERLMQAYLQTDPIYSNRFSEVWLWNEFPFKKDFGGKDTGIDLIAKTINNEYWAIQCKCYKENTKITKSEVDTFLSTSSKVFYNDENQKTAFSHRLWIDTTQGGFNSEAINTIKNQNPSVSRIGLINLEESPIDWASLYKGITGEKAVIRKKKLLEHQKTAVENTNNYFKDNERGKLIMACGTGKTYTSLCIAEKETNNKGLILFLVPSIALLSQTLREWSADAKEPINAICVCSDSEVSKKKSKEEDSNITTVEDLALPASTNIENIVKQLKLARKSPKGMTVVFSTYQSIDVISKAQKRLNHIDYIFDLIICDEAHRTTGVSLVGKDESAFIKVHSNDNINACKRLYMTATPRIYSSATQTKAREDNSIELCSMDDTKMYGDEIYRIGFGEAVDKQLLSDYKVLVLTMNKDQITTTLQESLANEGSNIGVDYQAKLIGCINALSKKVLHDNNILKTSDPSPMRKAVAFCQSIRISEKISKEFDINYKAYYKSITSKEKKEIVNVSAQHVDGTMGASLRDEKLQWLKQSSDDNNECRILTNVRCLSEGVDVPNLDAVLFLSARNSEIDVVQSVGRVMRTAKGKQYGYIIIPVIVPTDVEPEIALNNSNEFKVVWTILNALRAHDDRFNATINKIELNKKKPNNIIISGTSLGNGDTETIDINEDVINQLALRFEELQSVIYARMVMKVGNKRYWEQWAGEIAEIAQRHIDSINKLIAENEKYEKSFEKFLNGLRKNINPSLTKESAIELLAQHIITKPVFDALFENYSFVQNNPVSQSMEKMVKLLNDKIEEEDNNKLSNFYRHVQESVKGIDNAESKQKIIVELYDKFFKIAFPKVVEQLGIVYTPVEVVDFIINSVADVLKEEFDRNITDENVNIIDPFTGTGTFITRLLQSGLIKKEDLKRKYKKEIKANEIVLLAYYIASINIENVFHDLIESEENYIPFNGICLTDTFQLAESKKADVLFSDMFPQNSQRVIDQQNTPIHIIIGNPPYSVGQKSANDNAQNQEYPILEKAVQDKYVKGSKAGLNKAVYDSYIKAFRWATDRLEKTQGGIIGFVTNGAWIDSNGLDGFRKSLENEFTKIYVFNLRGNQRTSGELSRKEGGKIFGSGSRTPVSITILVKKTHSKEKAEILYHDIGDYLNREDKLSIIKKFKSIKNPDFNLERLIPNTHGDWINHRNDIFSSFIPIEPTKKYNVSEKSFFLNYSLGIGTNKDSFIYNSSKNRLNDTIQLMIDYYNNERIKLNSNKDYKLQSNKSKIVWTDLFIKSAHRNDVFFYKKDLICEASYRPFFKQNFCYQKELLQRTYQQLNLFPTPEHKNLVIAVSGVGASKDFSVLITDCIPDLQLQFNGQCFPMYYYTEVETMQGNLFDSINNEEKYIRHDAISDFILKRARESYGNKVIKEDLFYYVYGFLHSKKYRDMFSSDLKKMLPRIPLMDKPHDFWAFSKAGRKLAELHLNYENVEPCKEVVTVFGAYDNLNYRVEKMRFASKEDKTTIIYNNQISITEIPLKAYEYIVNGKSAIEWIMERYQVTTNKDSGITNNPNDWSDEHNNPKYIYNLLLSIINLSIKSVDIIDSLPSDYELV